MQNAEREQTAVNEPGTGAGSGTPLTQPRSGAVHGWQPIETAPKDCEVLVCGVSRAGYYVANAKLIEGMWCLFDPWADSFSVESDDHTHWMPLPQPPEAP